MFRTLFLPVFGLNVYVSFQWPVSVEAARNRGQSLSEPRSRVKTSHARRDPYRSSNGESVCLGFNLFAMCSRSRCWRTANCERGSAIYLDMLIANRILIARWERKPTHWKEIFFWGKTAETRNSPLPCSAEDENAVICMSTLPCVVIAGSLSTETNLQLLLPIYWPLKTDEAIFHTFVKVCCHEWVWREG